MDKAIDHKALLDTFSAFGNVLSCKVATDHTGQSKGYGFVQFDNEESAQQAIQQLNGMLLNDKQVYVGPFLRKQERDANVDKSKFNNVFVKNLAESTTEDDLRKIFSEHGPLTSVVVMKDAEGKSRCFGFVNFENADDAAKSVEALNGFKFQEKEWYVGKAQKKYERENELKQKYEQSLKEAADKYQKTNLYLKNLDDSVDDEKLKELFAPYGTITSCKVCPYHLCLDYQTCHIIYSQGCISFTAGYEGSKWYQPGLRLCCLLKPGRGLEGCKFAILVLCY